MRAIHSRRVHGVRDGALPIHDDDPAIARHSAHFRDDAIGGLLRALAVKLHARANGARDANADKIFARPGGGDAADAVLRVGARTDHRGVANAPPALACRAARRRPRGEIASNVARDNADSPELVIIGMTFVQRLRRGNADRARPAIRSRASFPLVAASVVR